MSLINLLWIAGLVVVCRAVPDGYILEVTHNCGANVSGSFVGANVTIKSDLNVKAHLSCSGLAGAKLDVAMTAINDTMMESTLPIYYNGDGTGTVGTDCFFYNPHDESNLHVVQLDVYWGFNNASLMNDYESYTITCTTDGNAQESISAKDINEDVIPITNDLEDNLGTPYAGTGSLDLIDALGNTITATKLPMGKKIRLQVSISGGTEQGLTPYQCKAENSDSSESYKILDAGCGTGVIIPKDEGFKTKGNVSTSPIFKAFKLIEGVGTSPSVAFSCDFVTCNNTCDGSSCKLARSRRSADPKEVKEQLERVKSQKYKIDILDERLDNSERELRDIKLDTRLRLSAIALSAVGVVALLSLMLALYSCVRVEKRRLAEQGLPRLEKA